YDVGIAYRSDHAGAEAVADAVRSHGGGAALIAVDVSDPGAVADMFDAHAAAFGTPHAVVSNAGIVPPRGRSLIDATVEEIDRVIAVNTLGALYVAREAGRRMARSRGGDGGVILTISSIAARLGSAGEYVDYAASKAAVDTMTLGLGHELARDGVRVVSLRPGTIETGIHAKGGQPDRTARVGPLVPMGRVGTVEEIAETALFLISDAASYITATAVDVSGGR
ncbi:MAG: SDR family oxidoreductase, partial [Rubricella sp.]